MLRDEDPLAPLSFLFSATFLATARARFALIAARHCVPYLPRGGLTDTFRTLLEEPLRQHMKVLTAVLFKSL